VSCRTPLKKWSGLRQDTLHLTKRTNGISREDQFNYYYTFKPVHAVMVLQRTVTWNNSSANCQIGKPSRLHGIRIILFAGDLSVISVTGSVAAVKARSRLEQNYRWFCRRQLCVV
jgi:hypothetical protein